MDFFTYCKSVFIALFVCGFVIGNIIAPGKYNPMDLATYSLLCLLGHTIVSCTERIIKAIWNSKGVNHD